MGHWNVPPGPLQSGSNGNPAQAVLRELRVRMLPAELVDTQRASTPA